MDVTKSLLKRLQQERTSNCLNYIKSGNTVSKSGKDRKI